MRRSAIATLGLLVLTGSAAGCGSSGGASSAPPAEPGAQAVARQSGLGEDAFYDYPDQAVVDKAAPGEILRAQKIPAPASSLLGSAASRAERIMYRTVDAHGRPVAATGFLLLPRTAPKDKDGWPLISWAHGTSGVGPACAPSRTEHLGGAVPLLVKWLREGYAVVAADYPGLGPNGKLHPIINLRAEGESVAHAALAARNADPRSVSDKWFAVGISQGGQAALGGGERAAEAKGMRFLGTAAFAPAAHHATALREAAKKQASGEPLDGFRGLLSYIAVGAHVYDPEKFPYEDLLSPRLAKEMAEPAVHNLCLEELDGYLSIFAPEDEYKTLNPDWETKNPEIARYLDSINPAQRTSAGPILVLQGERDTVVSPASTRKLITELCAKEDVVDWKTYPDADHVGVAIAGLDDLGAWMKDRLKNTRPTDRCPSAGVSRNEGK
ncbi:prolyl oligopeptidase family serine peptidase [Streptomyces albogriseolus]|uniref:prolyl oligopeptidase family serine peptidase n=1 Tax=Streptomyces TaxID=1883 RepID=UPI002A753607|nr:prolyl oligopeptidase family serine peptidase [Streptomyces sp. CL7]WPP31312.1 prolyl oligopeptidase family serine peptidase [Streptomyces sp. CL7]